MSLRRRANVLLWHLTQAPRRLARGAARGLTAAGSGVAAGIAFTGLAAIALVARFRTAWRRRTGKRPRLLWGPSANVNNKYWSAAMRERGYESRTAIDLESAITTREDWDVSLDEFLGGRFSERTRRYAMFAWALRHADAFMFYYDGGYLRGSPLDWHELRLLRLGGKKLIFFPYGGDIGHPDHLGRMKESTLADYPVLIELAPVIERRVLQAVESADVRIRNITVGYYPAYDVVWLTQLAIDTNRWKPDGGGSGSDGRSEPVVVLTAPNHRRINGTEFLEDAVARLRKEGLKIDLRILEGVPNEEIRAALRSADIVADQFLDPGYGMFPIEVMAAGKPMLTRMSPISDELQTEALRSCPLVDADPESLLDQLRRLVTDPALRRELGEAGRDYALQFHSHEAVGRDWELVIAHAWRGAPLPAHLVPPSAA